MRRIPATLLTLVFTAPAYAQAPLVPVPPVEQTEAPEDQATDPLRQPDKLPNPTPTSPPVPAAVAPTIGATPAKPPKWDVNRPAGARIRQVPINVDEGSWMDVDVSPDGRRVAFTLLGDIYTMPIEGGAATRISEGLAWEVHPRFSPDGTRIAFTSDRGGGDNIWLMNADGSDKRQVTKEPFRLLNQPTWSPDGRFIVAKKHFTTGRSLGTGESGFIMFPAGAGCCSSSAKARSTKRNSASRCSAPTARGSITRATSHRVRSSNMRRIRTPTCSTSNAMTSPPAK